MIYFTMVNGQRETLERMAKEMSAAVAAQVNPTDFFQSLGLDIKTVARGKQSDGSEYTFFSGNGASVFVSDGPIDIPTFQSNRIHPDDRIDSTQLDLI